MARAILWMRSRFLGSAPSPVEEIPMLWEDGVKIEWEDGVTMLWEDSV